MYLRKPASLLFILLLVLGIAHTLTAQSGVGSVQGTVTDATGAVIPAATVHVVNVATGETTDTKSNGVGFYQVPGLFTGSYRITFTVANMKTYLTSIDLQVAQNAVINPVLTAGAVTQRVTVTGNAIQLTTPDSGAIYSTVERDRIDQLPENGRLLTTLTGMTVPGLEVSGTRANGMLQEALQYVVDGATTTDLHEGAEYNARAQLPDPDSVQEVQVNMSTAGAQYSTPATAIVATKSGTNSLHGTAFETARNNAIGVAKSRANLPTYSAPPLVRNEFGASAGGPIILPHVYHGKDKSFWFFAYERYSDAQASSGEYSVPTPAMRGGDFSGLINGSGILQTIFNPSTTTNATNCAYTGKSNAYCRTPFSNNQIPAGELSPTAKIFFDLMPLPTSTDNPLVGNNLTANNSSFQVVPQVTFRLDHVFNDKNRAYVRFSDVDSRVQISGGPRSLAADGIPAGAAEGYSNNPGQVFLASVGYTHIFSPTFFAETVAGQQWGDEWTLTGADPTVNYEAKLGFPNNFGQIGFPGTSGLINNLSSSQGGDSTDQIISDLQENLTKIVGPHQLLFGGSWRHERMADLPSGLVDSVTFAAASTAIYDTSTGASYSDLSNTGYADASFFLGSASNYTINLEPPYLHYHLNEFDGYFQDNYHMTKNLVLNLGLRYEAHPAAFNKYGLGTSLDFKNDALVLASPAATLISEGYTTQAIITNDENIGMKFETPQQAGMPANTTLTNNYDLNFLPRAGLAYQLGKYGTVIRGGYGRYTYQTPMKDYLNHAEKQDPFTNTYSQSYTTASQAVDALPNELVRYNDPVQFGVLGVSAANVVNTTAVNSILPGVSLWSVAPDWAPAAVTETNFTIEQPLKGSSALRVSWVWTHSTNLDVAHHFNNNPSNFQWEMDTGTVPPTGGASVIGTPLQNTYAATALGPYDQTLWASASSQHMKTGWSDGNALQVNYQRLYRHGIAYQVYYVWSKALRAGGDQQGLTQSDLYPYSSYPGGRGAVVAAMTSPYGTVGPTRVAPPPPGNVPDWGYYHALNKFENYEIMTAAPFHHIQFNGVLDLPFGRGKWLFGNANRFVDELIGGFQIAGTGSIVSQEFQPYQSYGPIAPLVNYKHKYPIMDCRTGNCYKAYFWFNGYLAPTVTTGVAGSTCTSKCVTGLPADYVPDQTPIDNTPGTTYYGTNEVQITAPGISSGKATNIVFDAGTQSANYYSHAWMLGPWNYEADASIFKVLPITERIRLRIDMDAFNVLNVQGYTNPGTGGIEEVQPGVGQATSYNTPRQIQLTMRLSF